MIIFLVCIVILFCAVLWQALAYLRIPQGLPQKRKPLVYILLLFVVIGITTYAYCTVLNKEMQFLTLLPPYPGATLNISATPVFTDDPYWVYDTPATATQIFNWYRSRAKHAGWSVIEEASLNEQKVFAIRLSKDTRFFITMREKESNTQVSYTTEGSIVPISDTKH
jgi:hypothetical protein